MKMNSLSWMIYGIGVADNLGTGLGILFAIGVMGLFFASIGIFIGEEVGLIPYVKRGAIALVVMLIVMVFLPDRKTMLLIAGSEIGERAIQSESVKDVVNPGVDLLKTWIKDETDKIKNKKAS